MNRREFFKTTGVGLASVALLPAPSLIAQESTIPLYKQFEWVDSPVFILYKHNKDKNAWERAPFAVKTIRTKLCSISDDDLTGGNIITQENAHTANELLYKEAKMNGLTHLYCIKSEFLVSKELTPNHRVYYIRGAKVPAGLLRLM